MSTRRGRPKSLSDFAITTNSLSAGGAEKQRIQLANELAARGYQVTIYCLQQMGVLRGSVSDDVEVVQTRWWSNPTRACDVLLTGTTNTEAGFAIIAAARGSARRWLVAVHNPVGPGAPRLKKFARIGITFADAIGALSLRHRSDILEHWKLSTDHILPNGIDTTNASELRAKRADQSQRKYDIGYIGRISSHHKGLDRLLYALAEPAASALSLAIAGTGPDEQELRRLADKLDLAGRVHWLGHQNADEFFVAISVLALPSRYEAQPLVLLEAQLSGVPVVATVATHAQPEYAGVTVFEYTAAEQFAEHLQAAVSTGFNSIESTPLPTTVEAMADSYIACFQILSNQKRMRGRRFSQRLYTMICRAITSWRAGGEADV